MAQPLRPRSSEVSTYSRSRSASQTVYLGGSRTRPLSSSRRGMTSTAYGAKEPRPSPLRLQMPSADSHPAEVVGAYERLNRLSKQRRIGMDSGYLDKAAIAEDLQQVRKRLREVEAELIQEKTRTRRLDEELRRRERELDQVLARTGYQGPSNAFIHQLKDKNERLTRELQQKEEELQAFREDTKVHRLASLERECDSYYELAVSLRRRLRACASQLALVLQERQATLDLIPELAAHLDQSGSGPNLEAGIRLAIRYCSEPGVPPPSIPIVAEGMGKNAPPLATHHGRYDESLYDAPVVEEPQLDEDEEKLLSLWLNEEPPSDEEQLPPRPDTTQSYQVTVRKRPSRDPGQPPSLVEPVLSGRRMPREQSQPSESQTVRSASASRRTSSTRPLSREEPLTTEQLESSTGPVRWEPTPEPRQPTPRPADQSLRPQSRVSASPRTSLRPQSQGASTAPRSVQSSRPASASLRPSTRTASPSAQQPQRQLSSRGPSPSPRSTVTPPQREQSLRPSVQPSERASLAPPSRQASAQPSPSPRVSQRPSVNPSPRQSPRPSSRESSVRPTRQTTAPAAPSFNAPRLSEQQRRESLKSCDLSLPVESSIDGMALQEPAPAPPSPQAVPEDAQTPVPAESESFDFVGEESPGPDTFVVWRAADADASGDAAGLATPQPRASPVPEEVTEPAPQPAPVPQASEPALEEPPRTDRNMERRPSFQRPQSARPSQPPVETQPSVTPSFGLSDSLDLGLEPVPKSPSEQPVLDMEEPVLEDPGDELIDLSMESLELQIDDKTQSPVYEPMPELHPDYGELSDKDISICPADFFSEAVDNEDDVPLTSRGQGPDTARQPLMPVQTSQEATQVPRPSFVAPSGVDRKASIAGGDAADQIADFAVGSDSLEIDYIQFTNMQPTTARQPAPSASEHVRHVRDASQSVDVLVVDAPSASAAAPVEFTEGTPLGQTPELSVGSLDIGDIGGVELGDTLDIDLGGDLDLDVDLGDDFFDL